MDSAQTLIDLFIPDLKEMINYHCKVLEINEHSYIKNTNYSNIKLDDNLKIFDIVVKLNRDEPNKKYSFKKLLDYVIPLGIVNVSFMEWNNYLIPLRTHVFKEKNTFKVYDTITNESKSLDNFIVDNIPDTFSLYRVLSEDELAKWNLGDISRLGSYSKYFNEICIHTSFNSITSEFCLDNNYMKAVEFQIKKDELKKLIENDNVRIGTYGALFRGRKKNLFPFDFELRFRSLDGFKVLLDSYEKGGKKSMDNPFFKR